MSLVTPTSECLNCHAALAGPYCAACGQKAVAPNPTFHDVLHEFFHEMLHVDGRLWRSLRLLFTHPGWLTREYCAGRRASYLAPLRMYLLMAVLMFAASALIPSDLRVEQDTTRGQVVHAGGVTISGEQLLKKYTPEQIDALVHKVMQDWAPRVMLLLMPLWALLVQLFTRSVRRNYPEHLVFALHVNAAFAGAMILANLVRIAGLEWVNNLAVRAVLLCVVVYQAVALHRVYGGGWVRNAGRSIAITALSVVVLLAVLLALILVLLLY
jgi:hypothetical protein